MAVLKLSTPGVYVQEISTLPPSVAEVETAIPAFIGYTEKADRFAAGDLKKLANKIESFSDFVQFYGNAPVETDDSINVTVKDHGSNNYDVTFTYDNTKRSKYNLYYSVQHFYANGGGTCYIIAVDTYTGGGGSVKKQDLLDGLGVVYDVDEVTLLCIPEAPAIDQTDGGAAYKEVVNAMIKQASDLKDRFALIDPYKVTPKNTADPNGDIDGDVLIIRNATLTVTENRYAAAYYPNLITTYASSYDFDNLTVDTYTPDSGVTDQALGGVKMSDAKIGAGSILYTKVKNELAKQYVVLPPCGAMAGIYTNVDNNKGVWKAPANESVLAVVGPQIDISNREQESLNIDPNSGKSINVIRTFPGYGTLVWGARTLNGNDNEWRYISVRRFFNMVEESVKKSSQWAVFEPNTINTWIKIQAMIENYLFLKWREGALAGAKPEQAFFVNVGLGTTMTSVDILEGRMNVEIGMAVARPAEFIVLKFSQMMQQS
ncbi:MAG: phage tail sheath family protein [Bacteroidetes bacterium]|nr:phage tail sheath family protein [Bacteroidota bacterium]